MRYRISQEILLSKEEVGLGSEGNSFVVKEKTLPENRDEGEMLEKVISISRPGTMKDISLFRPEASQYSVWLDGKRYFSETRFDEKKKGNDCENALSLRNSGQAHERFPFPEGTGVFCYFLQVIECANYTGFIKKAIEKKAGQMNFHLIWEGHPYIGQQYLVPDELFTRARLSFDGGMAGEEHRFSLAFGDQMLFYFVNNDGQMTRKLWISEGLSFLMRNGDE